MDPPITGPITARRWLLLTLRDSLSCYFVMGSTNCTDDPRKVLRDALSSGVTMFQFREKGENCLTGTEAVNLAADLHAICKEHKVPYIVNDNIDLALEIEADGVHIGQEDGDAEEIRKRMGSKILGISAHSLTEANAAIKAGADYLGVGPMYPTMTKNDTRPVSGPILIEELKTYGIQLPIVGIGGINANNAAEVLHAGADGVAVISCLSSSRDPKSSVRNLITVIQEARKIIL
ncbi:thiamine phosphate synthase [Rossellomorea aquimaris]|uniref:Thiamine-phosphate synthase n=1 Tax=Rossellomorea aquimaris TaxID=189382 RepID=A0A5D4TY01_9BACI|nr:thiamine phosphate synthase [Rossellomorea aquimaris]